MPLDKFVKAALNKAMNKDTSSVEDSVDEFECPKCGYSGPKEDFEDGMVSPPKRRKPKLKPAPEPSDDDDEY